MRPTRSFHSEASTVSNLRHKRFPGRQRHACWSTLGRTLAQLRHLKPARYAPEEDQHHAALSISTGDGRHKRVQPLRIPERRSARSASWSHLSTTVTTSAIFTHLLSAVACSWSPPGTIAGLPRKNPPCHRHASAKCIWMILLFPHLIFGGLLRPKELVHRDGRRHGRDGSDRPARSAIMWLRARPLTGIHHRGTGDGVRRVPGTALARLMFLRVAGQAPRCQLVPSGIPARRRALFGSQSIPRHGRPTKPMRAGLPARRRLIVSQLIFDMAAARRWAPGSRHFLWNHYRIWCLALTPALTSGTEHLVPDFLL